MPPTVIKGNLREIPVHRDGARMPIGFWWEKVAEYSELPDLAQLPWTHELFEYLPPADLNRLRAKALVWKEVTGEWPQEIIYTWWEVRMARRRDEMPSRREVFKSIIDEEGVLHCGNCAARWAPPRDGSAHRNRCKLCDGLLLVVEDQRKETEVAEDHRV